MPYCARCGSEYQWGATACPNCGAAAPGAKLGVNDTTVGVAVGPTPSPAAGQETGQAAPASSHPAKATPAERDVRHKRFVAGLIDLAIGYALYVLVLVLWGRRVVALRWLMLVGLPVILGVPNPYLLLKDAIEGKSVGKLLMGLVVYDEREKRAGGLLDSIIRNWYLAIPWVGPTLIALLIGAMILAGKRKRLGDQWADTTVISDLEYQVMR